MKMQNNQNIRHFADQFLFCVRKANLSTASALVRDRFLHPIPAKLKEHVLTNAVKCQSLEELISLVISTDELESSLTKFSQQSTSVNIRTLAIYTSRVTSSENKYICQHHGNSNHSTEQCRLLKASNPTSSMKTRLTRTPQHAPRRINSVCSDTITIKKTSHVSSAQECDVTEALSPIQIA